MATCVFAATLALGCQDQSLDTADTKSDAGTAQPPASSRPAAGQGRWNAPSASDHDQQDPGLIERLMSIGYLRGSREAEKSGVTLHDRTRVNPGTNLFASGHAPEAILMDMEGTVLHRWHLRYEAAFGPLAQPNSNSEWWRRVAIFENGDLLAIYEGMGLVKLDKDSNLIWKSSLNAHHDLEVQANGDIYVLTRKARVVQRINPSAPILEDFVSVLNPDGKLKAEISLLEAFEASRFAHLVRKELMSGNGDIFHTNSISVLNGGVASRNRVFEKGNLLTSMNRLGVVAVVSIRLGQVIWVRNTAPIGQHDPKLLPNGNILLFTNNMDADRSTVEEFDPVTGETRWSYRGSEKHPLYSKYLGTAERLPNGNTLITESDGGRAIEVTPGGEPVWEFYNPNRAGSDSEFIATLPELIRLPSDFPIGWATGPSRAQ